MVGVHVEMQKLKSDCSETQAEFDTQRKEDINVRGLQREGEWFGEMLHGSGKSKKHARRWLQALLATYVTVVTCLAYSCSSIM
jgi:hypothetical protein